MRPPERRVGATIIMVIAVIALLGPLVLLARGGRSGATFGDNEQLGQNHLGAATLDLVIGSQSARLAGATMAPGDTVTGWLDLSNGGDLDLHYSIATANANDTLLDWLTWNAWSGTTGCSTTTGTQLASGVVLRPGATDRLMGNPATGFDPGDRILGTGERERICISATFSIDAPNDFQGRSILQEITVIAEHHLEEQP